MKPNRIPHNQLTRLDKINLLAPRAAQQAHPSQSKGESPSPVTIEPRAVVDAASGPMTNEELLNRAKRSIESCETSLRAAADDIARAHEQGATQRELAEGVGRSAAWVNRLLKWRSSGYEGSAFGSKSVQGVNKKELPLEPAASEAALATCAVPGEAGSAESVDRERLVDAAGAQNPSLAQENVNTAPAVASAAKIPTVAYACNDYRLPVGCNWLDPERAFQRLTEQWSSSSFRDLFLDSPTAAQERFIRDVILSELNGPKAVNLSPSDEESGR
ncbi:hypothetical protein KUL72_04280 [Bradyrhizobium arachidis]|uniref:hypothetical protein n=1 Tax=Bradyrhizobium arachidis TaxID=858423 RepID=UPI0021623234|nr:hypothetical protein [Bradyrhizobium arachidis]UVO37615.1 hypothetical protein KUL72_04280 [Bradyrhizobium arachidis]